jgi:hypothetical protein
MGARALRPLLLLSRRHETYSAGLIGACRRFTDATAISCALDPKLVSEVGDDLGTPSTVEFRPIANLRDDSLQGVVKLLAAEANSQGASGKLYADHLAHALALRFQQLSGGVRGPKPSQSGKMPTRILQRVLDRMRADFATNLDLHTIAAESGYSRTHFLRTFRASTGYSPHQWLTHLRIEEAKTLAESFQFSDRYRARLWFFEPWTFFEHLPQNRRGHPARIPPRLWFDSVRMAPFRE